MLYVPTHAKDTKSKDTKKINDTVQNECEEDLTIDMYNDYKIDINVSSKRV